MNPQGLADLHRCHDRARGRGHRKPSEVTAVLEEVSTLRKQALEQGQAVRDAITVDSQRTGRLIAELDY